MGKEAFPVACAGEHCTQDSSTVQLHPVKRPTLLVCQVLPIRSGSSLCLSSWNCGGCTSGLSGGFKYCLHIASAVLAKARCSDSRVLSWPPGLVFHCVKLWVIQTYIWSCREDSKRESQLERSEFLSPLKGFKFPWEWPLLRRFQAWLSTSQSLARSLLQMGTVIIMVSPPHCNYPHLQIWKLRLREVIRSGSCRVAEMQT